MRTFAILVSGLSLSACGPPPTYAEQYPGAWREPSTDVMRTLAKRGTRGCGEFYQKPHVSSRGEYVIACTRDGRIWRGYLVWTGSEQVLGPDDALVYQVGGAPIVSN